MRRSRTRQSPTTVVDAQAVPPTHRRAYEEFSEAFRELLTEWVRLRATVPMDPEEIPDVDAARSLIADTLASFPLVALENGKPMANQPALVRRPDPAEHRFVTVHRFAMHLTAGKTNGGNAWLMPTARDERGVPMACTLLDPLLVNPIYETGVDQRVIGARWGGRMLTNGTDVSHVPWKITGRRGTLGDSAITQARQSYEDLAAVHAFHQSYVTEFGAPSVKIKMPNRLKPGEGDEIVDAWIESRGGRRKPVAIGGGADVEPFIADRQGDEIVKLMTNGVAMVARHHLIPPSLLNAVIEGASLTYSTTRDELRRWKLTGLQPFITRLEAAFTDMVSDFGRFPQYSVRLDTSGLLGLDDREQAEVDATDIGSGVRSVEEARAQRGLSSSVTPVNDPTLRTV